MPRRKISLTCKQCNCSFVGFPHCKFCSQKCYHTWNVRENHQNWIDGTYTDPRDGYVYVNIGPNQRQLEHIVIAEKALGHKLPTGAVVHHWDENPSNNSSENLLICQDNAYHRLIHARMSRIKDTGSLDLKRCCACKQIKPLTEFNHHKSKSSWSRKNYECRVCSSAKNKSWRDNLTPEKRERMNAQNRASYQKRKTRHNANCDGQPDQGLITQLASESVSPH